MPKQRTELQTLLDREVTVLADRLRGWSTTRWRAKGRAAAAFALASRFAELAAAPVDLPRLDDHVLPDQIALTGYELLLTDPSEEVVEAALKELRRTREELGVS